MWMWRRAEVLAMMLMRRIESPSTGSAAGRRHPEGGDEACLGRARQADKPRSPGSAPNYRRYGIRISGARHHLAGSSARYQAPQGWPLAPQALPEAPAVAGAVRDGVPPSYCVLPRRLLSGVHASPHALYDGQLQRTRPPPGSCPISCRPLGSVHVRRHGHCPPLDPGLSFTIAFHWPRPLSRETPDSRPKPSANGPGHIAILHPWARSSNRLAGYDPRKPPGAAPAVAYQIPGLFYTAYYSTWGAMTSPSYPAPPGLRGLVVAWTTPDTSGLAPPLARHSYEASSFPPLFVRQLRDPRSRGHNDHKQ
ncbi:hypothetical protein EDB80DRAFT_774838 [Ilyonectria destructans]|nr:hypothetical protein EDB80DRAFT_774838 [Ilyonectria destructans]